MSQCSPTFEPRAEFCPTCGRDHTVNRPCRVRKPLAPWKEFLISKNKWLRAGKLEKRWRAAKRVTAIEGDKRNWLACWNHMFSLMGWQLDVPIKSGDVVSVAGLHGEIKPSTAHFCRVDGERVLIAEVFWTAYQKQQNGRSNPRVHRR